MKIPKAMQMLLKFTMMPSRLKKVSSMNTSVSAVQMKTRTSRQAIRRIRPLIFSEQILAHKSNSTVQELNPIPSISLLFVACTFTFK